MSCCKKGGDIFAGVTFVLAGILLILFNLGLLEGKIISTLLEYWYIGLILAGLAFIFRVRWLGIVIILITLFSLGVGFIGNFDHMDMRESTHNIPLEGITSADLEINFGAGDVTIKGGSSNLLLSNHVETSSSKDPSHSVKRDGDYADISISRQKHDKMFWKGLNENWDIDLSSEVIFDMDLDYGAANINLDLSDLIVDKLKIDNGASDTKITFGAYPTKADINAGASSFEFLFPEKSSVVVEVEGGLVNTDLDGFTKDGTKYFSEHYNNDENTISISISAGATSIEGKFYSLE